MRFFIDRPIFASVLALLTVLIGAISMIGLPISLYPDLVPPAVAISTQYIGANSEVVANVVTTPIEEQVNGAEGMIYMSSISTDNGNCSITVSFEVGYDGSFALFETQNRAEQALSQLPADVQQVGLTVQKNSSNLLMGVNLLSPNGTWDAAFLWNYLDIHVLEPLERLPGVAMVTALGDSRYAVRVWLDPSKLTALGLTPSDVLDSIQEQNQEAAVGSLGAPPAPEGTTLQYQLSALGRLDQVEQFEEIVIRAYPNGSVVRMRDVARVELGLEDYSSENTLNGKPSPVLAVFQLPDANGVDLRNAVVAEMNRLAERFPEDMSWESPYDTADFIVESMQEVVETLLIAIGLVFLVMFVFLQNWRTTLIPAIAIPVSLVGTFAFMAAFGFSINSLSMLGMVLAVGLVVDDAIVVVENVMRLLDSRKGSTVDMKQVTFEAMAQVRGPILATTLALMAVFVPMAFMPGVTGRLYTQFALTIAFAVFLSGFNSLTLTPALCAVILRPTPEGKREFVLFRWFNGAFDRLSNGYASSVRGMVRLRYLVLLFFMGLSVYAGWTLKALPTAFVPDEDQGYVIVNAVAPAGANVARTQAVMSDAEELLLAIDGISSVVTVPGYNIIEQQEQANAGLGFAILAPWSERGTPELAVGAIMKRMQEKLSTIPDAEVLAVMPPAIAGLGSTGGFQFQIEDLQARGIPALAEATEEFIRQAEQRPELTNVYTTFAPNFPGLFLDVDRVKAKQLGVSLNDVFQTLQVNLGSYYVNQLNMFGKVYRVMVQAEEDQRVGEADLGRLEVRNAEGKMIRLSALLKSEPSMGPFSVPHYQLYASTTVNGEAAEGYSSGQAVAAMEEVAAQTLPDGFGYEWTGLVYQQKRAGHMAPLVFLLSLVFVTLVLCAKYESWILPIIVLLAVPLGLLGAGLGLSWRAMDLDVYAQIGLVMLIGLTAKNAILIVEFAKDRRDSGDTILQAATEAARIRLRPILMTAFALLFGTLPLVFANGAGALSRRSLGTTVFSGMTSATILIVFVPVFYFLGQRLRESRSPAPQSDMDASR